VTQSGTWNSRTQDGSGNAITSTTSALDVNLKGNTFGTLTIGGTVTANQGGAPWSVSGSGTFAVTQSTSPWVSSVTTWAGGTLGAMSNYGISPGSVLVPGVNSFITNAPSITNITGTVSLPSGASTSALQTGVQTTIAPGTSPGSANVAGCVYNSSLPAPTNGQTLAVQCSNAGLLFTQTTLYDAAGQELAASRQNVRTVPLQVNQVPTSLVTAPALFKQLDAYGRANTASWITDGKDYVSVTSRGQGPKSLDSALVVTNSLVPALLCPYQAAVSQTSNTKVVAGQAGKFIHVCSYKVISATAQSVALIEGTGTTCGTGTGNLDGQTTSGSIALAANGGFPDRDQHRASHDPDAEGGRRSVHRAERRRQCLGLRQLRHLQLNDGEILMRKLLASLALLFACSLPAFAQGVCGGQGACVQQSPTRPDAAIAVALGTNAGTANQQSVATVTVPGGLYAYVTAIYMDVCGNGTGSAETNDNFTSTGLTGTPSWSFSATAANILSTCLRLGDSFATPLKSSAPGTNVVITSPTAKTNNSFTIRVYYYLAP
jgi:hypothetical protein